MLMILGGIIWNRKSKRVPFARSFTTMWKEERSCSFINQSAMWMKILPTEMILLAQLRNQNMTNWLLRDETEGVTSHRQTAKPCQRSFHYGNITQNGQCSQESTNIYNSGETCKETVDKMPVCAGCKYITTCDTCRHMLWVFVVCEQYT